jgi:D-aminoacyl-tRNA deacylase
MRLLIQRVINASVVVDKKIVGSIKNGALIFFGTSVNDDDSKIEILAEKFVNLRIFSDENDKMNLSIKDISGEVLIVSQFTLYADCSKGRRPSFINAGKPDIANKQYEKFVELVKEKVSTNVQTGVFGAMMQVHLINDGPGTFLLES